MAKGRLKIKWTKKRVIITAAVTLLAAAIIGAGTVYYLVYVLKPAQQSGGKYNQFSTAVQKLLSEPVPDEPISKAIFYAQVAQNYDNLSDPQNALTYYLKAQAVVDQNKLQDQIVYYQAIASDYQAVDNKTNARVYLQLYLKHLQQFLTDHPGDIATQTEIKAVQDRLQKL